MIRKKKAGTFTKFLAAAPKGLLPVAAGLLLAACSTHPPDRQTDIHVNPGYVAVKKTVSREILALMHKYKIAGVSIALIDNQKTVWSQGFGYADIKKNIPATASTVYRVGSITKLFTDTAAMQLVQRGKMNIDKPLATYIPGFSIRSRFPHAGPITPRNIMTHHSGLPTDYLKGMWGDKQAKFTQLPSLIKNEYVAYPPNEIFAYSNLGVTLLGLAVQNASGEPYAAYVDKHLLRPMGMNHSSFELTPEIRPLLSQAYEDYKLRSHPSLRDIPAGGLYSNVSDMARFAKMVFAHGRSGGHQIIKRGTLAEMLQPQNRGVPLDVGFHIGLGWIISDQGEFRDFGPVVWHDGGTLHFTSMLMLMPKHKLGVVVLTNGRRGILLAHMVGIDALRVALAQKTGVRQPPERRATKKPIAQFSTEALKSLPGYYATAVGPALIKADGQSLYAVVASKKFGMEPFADGSFGLYYRLLGLFKVHGNLAKVTYSLKKIEGHEVLVAHTPMGSSVLGEKIVPTAIPPAWRKRLGRYQVANPDKAMPIDQVRLQERDRMLQVHLRLNALGNKAVTESLLPISATDAIVAGLGRGRGETVHATVRDGVTYLHYSGYAFRRLQKNTGGNSESR